MKLVNYKIMLLPLLLLTLRCTDPVSDGGGGSETTNSFTASVNGLVISGKGIPGYSVDAYSVNYRPYSKMKFFHAEIGSDNKYSLILSDSGMYNIFSLPQDSINKLVVLLDNVTISGNTIYSRLKAYSIPGEISICSDTSISPFDVFVLYLRGTPFKQVFSRNSVFPLLIKNVPESEYTFDCEKASFPVTLTSDTSLYPKATEESVDSVKVYGKMNSVIKLNSIILR